MLQFILKALKIAIVINGNKDNEHQCSVMRSSITFGIDSSSFAFAKTFNQTTSLVF